MDALNFLYEKPTLSWFEFYLNSEKLREHLADAANPEPSVETLVSQFCEQAKYEESFFAQVDLPKDELEYHQMKSRKLWVLTLKICAYLRWNTTILRKNISLVNLKRIVEELCGVTWDTNSLACVLTSEQNLNEISPVLRFAALFSARWVLDEYVHDCFPQPPPKITVSNPSAQIDPSQPFMEAKSICLATLQCVCDVAANLLEKALASNLVDYCIFSPEMFEVPAEGAGDIYLNKSKIEPLPLDAVKMQLKFDLGIYYFFVADYEKAKAQFAVCQNMFCELRDIQKCGNGHWTFDENILNGYCNALGLSCSNISLNAAVTSAPTEQTAAVLLERHRNEYPSSVVRSLIEENAITENPLDPVHAQIVSANFLRLMFDLIGVNASCISFFEKRENAVMFCLALKKHLQLVKSENEKLSICIYLKFLCALVPCLRESLGGCGFDDFIANIPNVTQTSFAQFDSVPNYYLMSNFVGMWSILNAFDPVELKKAFTRARLPISTQYMLATRTIHQCTSRLPISPVQDMIILGACKAQQLAAIGSKNGVAPLIELIVGEYRSCANDLPLELIQENLRLDLICWHDLAYRCSDVNRVGAFTQDLASKVKAFVSEAKKNEGPLPSPDLSLLCSAFLLNTCDFEYLIAQCQRFRSRFMDFAKVLAALCHEVSRGGNNQRSIAREFFDFMLSTMMDSGAGARNQLLSRPQFVMMVKLMKEQMAITILLSFLGKLFNCKQGGLTEVFIAHPNLWPVTYADANNVGDTFLKEVMSIIFENALIVNSNNAFYLRTIADFRLANEDFALAMQYYLQCLAVCSDYFSKPFSNNIVDDKLIQNLIKCCGRLECHTAEALFCQFVEQPSYNAAVKALQEATSYDGLDAYFPFIWDTTLLELIIANTEMNEKSIQQGRIDTAIRVLSQQEINAHNSPSVLCNVIQKRKADFLSSLCNVFF